jgi:hypothetical protein
LDYKKFRDPIAFSPSLLVAASAALRIAPAQNSSHAANGFEYPRILNKSYRGAGLPSLGIRKSDGEVTFAKKQPTCPMSSIVGREPRQINGMIALGPISRDHLGAKIIESSSSGPGNGISHSPYLICVLLELARPICATRVP